MEEDTTLCLDDLRRRSKTLLARAEKNSQKIDKEIKRLYLQNSELGGCYENEKRRRPNLKNRELWRLRNDSSAVNDLLCPDYQSRRNRRKSASAPNMRPLERIVIPSKSLPLAHCTSTVKRKPVKGCYCNVETRKGHSLQAKQKPTITQDVSPPLSCETVRRLQRINYSPRSQFLRNTQKKISVFRNVPSGDCNPDTCLRLLNYRELLLDKATEIDERLKNVSSSSDKPNADYSETLSPSRREEVEGSVADEKERFRRETAKQASKAQEEKPVKRTISSKKISQEGHPEKTIPGSRFETYRAYPKEEHGEWDEWTLREKDDQEKVKTARSSGVKDLKKFREENYFDTHGSSQTLASSGSSGSLEQCLLNDRLFPEPIGRIHKKNLVVTMPACATVQKKRVHYFPRYVVRQEKCDSKKKRCNCCPLTGHAIDLGISKPRPVLNSFALKYQKRLP